MKQTDTTVVRWLRARSKSLVFLLPLFVLLGLSLSAVTPATAATNTTLNFQARLRTDTGATVSDGDYNVQFKLYDVDTGGTALWTESWYDLDGSGGTTGDDYRLTVRNGYLTVNLGSRTAFPTTINWDQTLWITMNVGGTTITATPTWDGEMDPRLRLTGVPYAFRAGQLATGNGSLQSTLQLVQPTVGSQVFQIRDQAAAGTYNLLTENEADAGYIQNGTALQTANFSIQSAAAGDIAARIYGAASQTADILQIRGDGVSAALLSVSNIGAVNIQPSSDAANVLTIKSATGNNMLTVDSSNSRVGIGLGGSNLPSMSNAGLEMRGSIKLTGGTTDDDVFTTPQNSQITTRLNIPLYDPGQFNQVIALGLPSTAHTDARVLTLLDARSGSHQPSLSLLSPDESKYLGLSWDGSNTEARIKTSADVTAIRNGDLNILTARNNSGSARIGIGNDASAGYALNVTGTVNASGSYYANGTAGATVTCAGGNFLQNAEVSGGIVTGGTCAAASGSGVTSIDYSTTANAEGGSISGTILTLHKADGSNPGLLSADAQTIGGDKTFAGTTTFQAAADANNTVFLQGRTSQSAATLLIRQGATQSGRALDIQDSNSVSLFNINEYGSLNLAGGGNIAGRIGVGTTESSGIQLRVVAASGNVGLELSGNGTDDLVRLFSGNGATRVLTVTDSGQATFQNQADSTAAFAVKNSAGAGGATVLGVDTTGSNISLLGNNTNKLSAWTSTTAMSVLSGNSVTARVRGGAVTANGYLYHIGGTDGSATQATVAYAKLNADGTIGTWASTTALPEERRQFQPVVANGYLYVIGGRDGSSNTESTAYYAKLNSDGTVGAWNATTPMNDGSTAYRFGSATVSYNGYIYVIGGFNQSVSTTLTTMYVKVNTDGTLGDWSTTTVLPEALANINGATIANGYVYLAGGYDGGGEDDITRAKLNADGTLGSWTVQAGLLNSTGGGDENYQLYTANGYLYVVGGDYDNRVVAFVLNADGSVGTQTSLTDLPVQAGEIAGAQANGYFYILGGSSSGDGSGTARNSVYYASVPRVTIGGSLDLLAYGGENLAEGRTGGTLTAGNTRIVGTMDIQDSASFARDVSIGGDVSVRGTVGTRELRLAAVDGSGNYYSLYSSAGELAFYSGAIRAVLTASGDFAIGTNHTSPEARLDVDGDAGDGIRITNDNDNAFALMINNEAFGSTNATGFGFYQGDNGHAVIGNNNVLAVDIDTSGHMLIQNNVQVGGSFSQAGANTFATATGAVSLNGDATVAAGKMLIVAAGATELTGPSAGNWTALTINTGATTNAGLIIEGVTSQSADLLDILDGAGTSRVKVDAAGALYAMHKPTANSSAGSIEVGSIATQTSGDINGVIGFVGYGVQNAQIAYSVGDGFYLCNSSASAAGGDYGQCSSRVNLYAQNGGFNGNLLQSGAGAFQTGTGAVSLNGHTTIAGDKTLVFAENGGSETVTLQSGATAASYTMVLPTAIGATGECLKAGTVSGSTLPLTWGGCGDGLEGGGSTLQQAYDNSGSTDPQIQLDGTNGGVKIQDAATTVGNILQIQNNDGSATYLALTSSAMTLQDSSGNNAFVFDSSTSHLRVYANTSSPTLYADIYYDAVEGEAVFSASSGNTRVGSGTGNISLELSGVGDVLSATKELTLSAAYSANDFSFTRNFVAGANAVTGSVVNIESLSSGSNISSTMLLINQNNTSATGNLITANKGGSGNTKFSVSVDGSVNIAAGQSYAGAGALTLSAGATALTLQSTGSALPVLVGGGNTSTDATPSLLVLDHKSTANDPTGTNGGMYYNASSGKFRCYENGAWKDCITTNEINSRSFVDSTSDAAVDANTTDYWDNASENNNSRPYLAPSTTSKQIYGIVSLEGTATGTADVDFSARIERNTGSAPTCGSGTSVGGVMGVFATNTGSIKTSTATFLDSPATTSSVYYTVCSDAATSGTGMNITRLRFTLFEVSNSMADLAEVYPTMDVTLRPGEIVSIDPSLQNGVKRSSGSYDRGVLGVISGQAAMVMGGTDGAGATGVAVALSGRVPVKVSAENGPVRPGDHLTASSVPGVAMKATKAGQVIGTALETYDGKGIGQVMTFVRTGNYGGETLAGLLTGSLQDGGGSGALGLQALSYFMEQRGNGALQGGATSDILADRVAAAIEIVAPTVTADRLNVNTISAAGGGMSMSLGTDGSVALQNASGNTVARIDSQGNAAFSGTVSAGAIDADAVASLSAAANAIGSLQSQIGGLQSAIASMGTGITTGQVIAGGLAVSGDAVIRGSLEVGAVKLTGDLELGGHFITRGAAPKLELLANAGSTSLWDEYQAEATITGNDTGGKLRLTIGSLAKDIEPGDLIKVSFDKRYAADPQVLVSARGLQAARAQVFVSDVTSEYFTIMAAGELIAGQTYEFTYFVFQ